MSKLEITPQLLAALNAKAEAATPGPWCLDWSGYLFRPPQTMDEDDQLVARLERNKHGEIVSAKEDTDYIVTASPDVVLALIAKVEQLEKEADWLAKKIDEECCFADVPCDADCNPCDSPCRVEQWREAARKAVVESDKSS